MAAPERSLLVAHLAAAARGKRASALLALLSLLAVLSFWALGKQRPRSRESDAIRVTARPIPHLATAARVDIEAPGALGVVVRYGRDAAYGNETPRFTVPASGKLSTTLVALDPAATVHVQVVAELDGGGARTSRDVTVVTPPLDAYVPKTLEVTAGRGVGNGYVLVALSRGKGGEGLAAIVDRSGRIVWYRQRPGSASGLQQLPNGRLLVHQGDDKGFEEIELDGTVVRTFRDERGVQGTDGHDILPLPDGNALVFGAETHTVDSRPFFPGGIEHAMRWDDTVSEVSARGDVLWRWSSYNRVSESEITPDFRDRDPWDPKDYEVVHTNTIEPMPDGNILVSFRNTSSVVKIDRRSGDILWRLGGKRSDFRIEGDPLGAFNRQHDTRLVGEDRILMFDNGNFHEPPESRAVEYRLDYASKTATFVWQFRRSPPLFAHIAGSVERLPNGHTLIAWGYRGIVSEVTTDGATVWELKAPSYGVYRARAISSMYP